MTRLPLSPAASGLVRALVKRCGVPRDRILLTEVRSVDWQSLTFVGERHEIGLTITGPEAQGAARALLNGLDEYEFDVAGQIVADIRVAGEPVHAADGSIAIFLEALTVAE